MRAQIRYLDPMITLLKHPPCKLSFSIFLHTSATLHSSFYLQRIDSYITKCSSAKQLEPLNAQIILRGLTDDPISLSKLSSFLDLSSSGDLQYAHHLFDKIPQPNRHMYNTLIRAFSGDKNSDKAIPLYKKMVSAGISPNEFTFPFALKSCAFRKSYFEDHLIEREDERKDERENDGENEREREGGRENHGEIDVRTQVEKD